jgi:hypothetical protein
MSLRTAHASSNATDATFRPRVMLSPFEARRLTHIAALDRAAFFAAS